MTSTSPHRHLSEARRIAPNPSIHGVPREVTSFVGRRRELDQLAALLRTSSLITLTGTGGVGKTRLATRLATDHAADYLDGVWFFRLNDVAEDALVEPLVDRALMFGDGEHQALTPLVDRLAERRVLIVLDNCEHVLGGAARLAHDLLHSAPGVQIVTTSRESLKILGEAVFEVPPLSTAHTEYGTTPLTDNIVPESVQLFLDRAGSSYPGFHPAPEELTAIATLCERLDSLPLAIELAAVRARAISASDLLSRQGAFLDLLTRGNTGDERHQTLRGTIQWSFDLCSPKEQELWKRLAVFAGGFEVDAAEAICTDDMIARHDVPVLLADLVDKSVLATSHLAGRVRYRLLESIRAFGFEKLRASTETARWQQRHLEFHIGLAEISETDSMGVADSEINRRLRRELANLEAAITLCLDNPENAGAGMRLVGSLWFFWNANGHLRAGQFWLTRILEVDRRPSPERAKCLWVLGWFESIQGGNNEARLHLEESIDTAAEVGDQESHALATQFLGTVEHIAGNLERAMELLEMSSWEHNERHAYGSLPSLGTVQKAFVYALSDEPDRAVELSDAALADALRSGEQFSASWALWTKGIALWFTERYPEAGETLRQAVEIKRELHDWLGVSVCLDVLAWVAVRENRMAEAAGLWGGRAVGSTAKSAASRCSAVPSTSRSGRSISGWPGKRSVERSSTGWSTMPPIAAPPETTGRARHTRHTGPQR
ncbi:ATP-binding protein [Gordonia humi]|uniref:ATP-binding protein n=1 Tax=Gordonia humi TaxID=686429 RepID=UPI003618C812